MPEKSNGSDRQSRGGVTAVEASDPQFEVVFENFFGELDCFLVRASRPNQESNHRSCIGGVARRVLYRIRAVLPAHRAARDESRGHRRGLQRRGSPGRGGRCLSLGRSANGSDETGCGILEKRLATSGARTIQRH